MPYTDFELKFANLINAGFPYIFIPTYEEERVTSIITKAADDTELIRAKRKIYIWTQTNGFLCDGKPAKDTLQPIPAIDYVGRSNEDAIFILKDFHVYFGAERNGRPDHSVIRKLRDILPDLKSSRKPLFSSRRNLRSPAIWKRKSRCWTLICRQQRRLRQCWMNYAKVCRRRTFI